MNHPDLHQRDIEMRHDRVGATLQHPRQLSGAVEGDPDVGR
jgi:hypothetical protein